jgi:alcohol dehydrogenase class IV
LIIQEIENLLELAKIPKNLSDFSVNKTDLDGFNEFAKQAKAALDYNPVKIDPTCVAKLFITI